MSPDCTSAKWHSNLNHETGWTWWIHTHAQDDRTSRYILFVVRREKDPSPISTVRGRVDVRVERVVVACREDGSDWMNLELSPPSNVPGLHLGEMAFESQPRNGMDMMNTHARAGWQNKSLHFICRTTRENTDHTLHNHTQLPSSVELIIRTTGTWLVKFHCETLFRIAWIFNAFMDRAYIRRVAVHWYGRVFRGSTNTVPSRSRTTPPPSRNPYLLTRCIDVGARATRSIPRFSPTHGPPRTLRRPSPHYTSHSFTDPLLIWRTCER